MLPTLKLYKIGVKLDMTGKTSADAKAEVLAHERPERRVDMPAPELSATSRSPTIRVVQEDLPLVERPVRRAGRGDRLLRGRGARRCSQSFKERKLMRRFAAVMNHRSAGYKANAMGVWAVPDDELEDDRAADGRVRRA